MRFTLLATLLVASSACAPLRGPGSLERRELKTPGYRPTGSTESGSGQEPLLPKEAYTPSDRAKKRGYSPRSGFALTWPLNMMKINQPFRPLKKRRPHLGVDFAGTRGTPIFSAHEGLVIYAGRAFKGFGKLVIVEYDDQWATLYAHLDKILVKQGQVVSQGQTLGKMGRTGRATGVHLHFELLHNQRPIDPIPLLNEAERLVNTDSSINRTPATGF